MRIFFNTKPLEVEEKTSKEVFELMNAGENDIWVVNGFATKESLLLKEGDELFCIPKDTLPPYEVLDSMMRARHTPKLHDKLRASKVAICGLGGLGSYIAIMLARSGIGELLLIDFDTIDASNLNRQSYRVCDLGRFKTEALSEQIQEINPFVKIVTKNLRITAENLPTLFANCDVVCEAFDNVASKSLFMREFHKFYAIPLICGSGLAGYGDSNSIATHKIAENLYVCGDLKKQAQANRGLMAPRVNICAAHQANLVLELLAESENH